MSVHYLVNKLPQQFARLQTELIHLRVPTEAWALALPDLPPSQLDSVLEDYRRSGHYLTWQLPVPVPESALAVRVMADAEAHAVRALMFETGAAPGVASDRAAAQSETAEALAADSTNVEALAFRSLWFSQNARPIERAALAQRAVEAHPDAWLAWLMVAAWSGDKRARRTALARGLALAPEQPHLLSELACLDADDGRWAEALLLATKASQVGERFGIGLPLRMLALAHVGRCADAADLAKALEIMAPAAVGRPVRRDWEKLRQSCDEAPAAIDSCLPCRHVHRYDRAAEGRFGSLIPFHREVVVAAQRSNRPHIDRGAGAVAEPPGCVAQGAGRASRMAMANRVP